MTWFLFFSFSMALIPEEGYLMDVEISLSGGQTSLQKNL